MFGQDNLYSRFVAWSKVLLPLAAISLLSTLFLLAKGRGGEGDLPYAEIEAIALDSRLSNPNISGVNADGASYTITASQARPLPGSTSMVEVERILAQLQTADGLGVEITAGKAELDTTTRRITLSALARLVTSNGYQMETTGLIADMGTGDVRSIGPLAILAPYGELSAGQVTIGAKADGTGTEMVFKGGVRLIYRPEQ